MRNTIRGILFRKMEFSIKKKLIKRGLFLFSRVLVVRHGARGILYIKP
jgi:hypothetical protein